MADTFTGNPAPLRVADFEAAARHLGCTVAAIRAVATVESAGAGFLDDRRPKILFERHIFHARTGGRFGAAHSNVSSLQPGGYLGGAREYERLSRALRLDRRAALESASWGRFQIMGFNFTACGHGDVESFVKAMVSGEPEQLRAFVAFIRSAGLADELVRQDWAGFARGYNGPAYARNAYDRKIAEAHARFQSEAGTPLLQIGDTGEEVKRLQRLLKVVTDGVFGPGTKAAVMTFQNAARLVVDGIVGTSTWKALLA